MIESQYNSIIRGLILLTLLIIAIWLGIGCDGRNNPSRSHQISVHQPICPSAIVRPDICQNRLAHHCDLYRSLIR